MQNFLICLLLPLFCCLSQLQGVIIETAHFHEICEHIRPNTLVLLDIDDTLIIPQQTLGSDVWFIHQLKNYREEYSSEEALDKALADWEAIRHLTQMKIVEEGTPEIVKKLQEQQVTVMCLTTQGLALATRTVNQLIALGIDPIVTAPSREDHYFLNGHGVLYRHGVLFTSGTPKGPALVKLLDILGITPEHVVFINDKQTHLRDVEETLNCRQIPFTGLRYTYSDDRVNQFNPEIAKIQWEKSSFGKILSDEEAEKCLSNQK